MRVFVLHCPHHSHENIWDFIFIIYIFKQQISQRAEYKAVYPVNFRLVAEHVIRQLIDFVVYGI